MKLYTYLNTTGGEDEYLIAKDDQIAPEAGAGRNGRKKS